jgi:hypothetical protein
MIVYPRKINTQNLFPSHNFKFICYFQKIVHSVTTEGKTIAHAPDTMARFPDMAQYSVSRL